jgi:REP element-mobilizing transposase RayT
MKRYNPDVHRRRSIRLQGHDYSQHGLYFATICTYECLSFFGNIVNGEMRLNDAGKTAEMEWLKTPSHRPYVVVHDFVIMPNHFHGIIEITDNVGALRATPLQITPANCLQGVARNAPTRNAISNISPKCGTLSVIVRAYKSAVSKSIHETNPGFAWQRSYYEHIIRSEKDYNRIVEYIKNNPASWNEDRFYPS